MTKYVITGVDGQFGGHAAKTILARGIAPSDLIFTSPVPEKVQHFAEQGVDVRAADFTSPQSLEAAFAGGDALLLISMPIIGEKRRAMHQNAVNAAKAAGVKLIVYTSFLGAGDPENDALVNDDHNATEDMIKASGLDYKFCRNSQYAEAVSEFVLPGAFMNGEWRVNQGTGEVAYVSRRDCAECAVALLLGAGENNKVYPITGAERLDGAKIAALAKDVTGKSFNFVGVTDEECYAGFDAIGVPRDTDHGMAGSPIPWCSDDMVSFGRCIRLGQLSAMNNSVKELTGHDPIPMRQLFEECQSKGLYGN